MPVKVIHLAIFNLIKLLCYQDEFVDAIDASNKTDYKIYHWRIRLQWHRGKGTLSFRVGVCPKCLLEDLV